MRVMMLGPFPRSAGSNRWRCGRGRDLSRAGTRPGSRTGTDRRSGRKRQHRDFGSPETARIGQSSTCRSTRGASVHSFGGRRVVFGNSIDQYRPDIVHAQGADLSGLLAVGCKVPAVVTIHGVLGECAKLQTDPVVKTRDMLQSFLTERPTVRDARDLISISPYIARYYVTRSSGRIHDIPNPVGVGVLQRAPRAGTWSLFSSRDASPKARECWNWFGRRDSTRGPCRRLCWQVARRTRRTRTRFEGKYKYLGLAYRVEFAGLFDEPALLAEFARAEALVLPSYQETAPMVVQQAMAAGLPVLATRRWWHSIPDRARHLRAYV